MSLMQLDPVLQSLMLLYMIGHSLEGLETMAQCGSAYATSSSENLHMFAVKEIVDDITDVSNRIPGSIRGTRLQA